MAKSDSTESNERAQLEQQIADAQARGDSAEVSRLTAQRDAGEQQGGSGESGNRTTQQ